MNAAVSHERITEAEFLQLERLAETKSQFFDGEIFAMSGGTHQHSLIGVNLTRELGNRLEGRPCITFNNDLRIKVEASGLITYPDVSVVCGPQEFLDEEKDTLLNPTLIGEVLSDSTERFDRGRKFVNYRLIPSLRHFLLVSQKEPRMECYTRIREGEWSLREAVGLGAILELPALDIAISPAKVFARAEFDMITAERS